MVVVAHDIDVSVPTPLGSVSLLHDSPPFELVNTPALEVDVVLATPKHTLVEGQDSEVKSCKEENPVPTEKPDPELEVESVTAESVVVVPPATQFEVDGHDMDPRELTPPGTPGNLPTSRPLES